MTVQEMIKECINKTQIKAITEQMKISMRAWLECAVDFGKDNDELTVENEKLNNQIEDLKQSLDFARGEVLRFNKGNKELQEENLGLKARLNAINLLTPELEKSSKLRKQQLSEAKEIIKELCGTIRALNNPNTQLTDIDVYLAHVDAFLKE